MKILIASDSFKGSLSSVEAADIIARSITSELPEAEVIKLPLSDGGDGLVDALCAVMGGTVQKQWVTGPLGKRIEARYALLDDHTAVIEMAAASGILLVPDQEKNPLVTTTYGTGELIKSALDKKCRRIIIGIGGSATNDGGAGMAQALGACLLDGRGNELPWGGGALEDLMRIDLSGLDKRLKSTEIIAACDVDNPLTGENGASFVYGPQKGATRDMVVKLDNALHHYGNIIMRDVGKDISGIPGAGAAGGLGAGLLAFTDCRLQRGIDLYLNLVGFEAWLKGVELVITGEGSLDQQSLSGKVPIGVARRAALCKIPVLALAGSVLLSRQDLADHGITAAFSIINAPLLLTVAMEQAPRLLSAKAAEIASLLHAFSAKNSAN